LLACLSDYPPFSCLVGDFPFFSILILQGCEYIFIVESCIINLYIRFVQAGCKKICYGN